MSVVRLTYQTIDVDLFKQLVDVVDDDKRLAAIVAKVGSREGSHIQVAVIDENRAKVVERADHHALRTAQLSKAIQSMSHAL